jgi:two-component system CheB/CheR fusion protein
LPVVSEDGPARLPATESLVYLVILEAARSSETAPAGQRDAATGPTTGLAADALVAALKQELRAKEEYLQSTHEELETANEELKSANEEMQSVNEELQSTNEELETSKEELQSVNEELSTVNNELQTKVADLSRANNDMNNLLAGTGIATVFVDHQLRILRFTPKATQIIHLIVSDVGRPVNHIVSKLKEYDRLAADIRSVLDTLISKTVEVQTAAGAWYTMRIQPYRTLENVIEGAVLTFVDISEMKLVKEALDESEQQLKAVFDLLPDSIYSIDPAYKLILSNRAFQEASLAAQAKAPRRGESVLGGEYSPELGVLWKSYYDRALGGESFSVETISARADGPHTLENFINPMRQSSGAVSGVVVFSRDITAPRLVEEKLLALQARLEKLEVDHGKP